MPLIISGVDLIVGGEPLAAAGGVSGPSPPTIAPAREVFSAIDPRQREPPSRWSALICLSVL